MKRKARPILKQLVILIGLIFILAGIPGGALGQEKLKVGIIHIGSINDAGYNQAHSEGVQAMKRNLPNVEVIQVENVPEGGLMRSGSWRT